MRKSLLNLFQNTVVFKYQLPNSLNGIEKSIYTTIDADYCYGATDEIKLSEIIYNSLIDYAYNEEDLADDDLNELHFEAIEQRLRIEENDSDQAQLKYGFFGEVLFNLILQFFFKTQPIIAKGYFYDILNPEENKGYDSFHLIQTDKEISLWFGETKFYLSYKEALKSIFNNIEKAISNDYFRKNLLAIKNRKRDLNIQNTELSNILNDIRKINPVVSIESLKNQYGLRLVYPIFLVAQETKSYDGTITSIIDCIKTEHYGKNLHIGIDYDLFFVLLPVSNVKQIKQQVLQWIKLKKPLTLL